MILFEANEVKQKVMDYGFNERNYMAVVSEGLNQADVLGIDKARRAIEFEIKTSRADLQKELAAIRYAKLDRHKETIKLTEGEPEQIALFEELGRLKKKSGGWTKISKHEEYTDPVAYFEKMSRRHYYHNGYVPNIYYFVVPEKLVPLALEGTKGTKYGVIAYDGCRQKDQHYGYLHNGHWYGRWDDRRPEEATWSSGRTCDDTCRKEITVRRKATKIHDKQVSEWVIDAMLQRAVRENINMLKDLIRTTKALKMEREKKIEE